MLLKIEDYDINCRRHHSCYLNGSFEVTAQRNYSRQLIKFKNERCYQRKLILILNEAQLERRQPVDLVRFPASISNALTERRD